VPPVKKASASTRRSAFKEPAALKQLSKSLDGAQAALTKLRGDLGRDVSSGSKALYKDLERVVKDARGHSGKLAKALQRDVTTAAKPAARKPAAAKPAAAKPAARKPAAAKPAARKPAAAKPAARKPAARKPAARKPAR
jgi:hypothetical protein